MQISSIPIYPCQYLPQIPTSPMSISVKTTSNISHGNRVNIFHLPPSIQNVYWHIIQLFLCKMPIDFLKIFIYNTIIKIEKVVFLWMLLCQQFPLLDSQLPFPAICSTHRLNICRLSSPHWITTQKQLQICPINWKELITNDFPTV